MKYLIIDDNVSYAKLLSKELNESCEIFIIVENESNAKLLSKELNGNCETFVLEVELSKVADSIKSKIPEGNTDTVILININLKTGKARQEHEGITLLKWLRLKECNSHCILYSFQSLHSIVKANPLNSILYSIGVSFIQLPFSSIEISVIPKGEKAKRDNLLPYFRAEIDLVKIRHELANIWAIHRMKEVLGIEKNKENSNYSIQILKFLSADFSNTEEYKNDSLLNQIRTFQANGKKIFYYDDLADEWAIPLEKLFGKDKIEVINAKTVNQGTLLHRIQLEKPGCLLLDLRLANEKDVLDVLEYSGGKVLQEVKRRFITLPVIMFTATNKAENVRRLLSAGAEYVWTKEGIDDGINNQRSLQNIKNLLDVVITALAKFKNQTYEMIYEAEIKFNNVSTGIFPNVNWSFPIKSYNIYIDANYLINSIKDGFLHSFHELLLKKPKNLRIKIHEDVVREILNISQQDERFVNRNAALDRNNPYRVPVCRFLLEKIFEWRQLGLVWIENEGGQDSTIKEVAKLNLPDLPQDISFENQIEEKTSFWKRLFVSAEESNQTQLDKINAKVSEINNTIDKIKNTIESLPDFETLKLHADNTFINIIPNDLAQGNVILVTDDNRCAHDVGKYFRHNPLKYIVKQEQDYWIEKTRNYAPCNVEFLTNGPANLYQHKKVNEFNKIIGKWCKEDVIAVRDIRDGIVTGFLPNKQNPNAYSGAFILINGNKTGFLHINSLGSLKKTTNKINDIAEVLSKGDSIKVEITEIKADGKISLKGISKIFP